MYFVRNLPNREFPNQKFTMFDGFRKSSTLPGTTYHVPNPKKLILAIGDPISQGNVPKASHTRNRHIRFLGKKEHERIPPLFPCFNISSRMIPRGLTSKGLQRTADERAQHPIFTYLPSKNDTVLHMHNAFLIMTTPRAVENVPLNGPNKSLFQNHRPLHVTRVKPIKESFFNFSDLRFYARPT